MNDTHKSIRNLERGDTYREAAGRYGITLSVLLRDVRQLKAIKGEKA